MQVIWRYGQRMPFVLFGFWGLWFVPPDPPAPEDVPGEVVCDAWACEGSSSGRWVNCECLHYSVEFEETP